MINLLGMFLELYHITHPDHKTFGRLSINETSVMAIGEMIIYIMADKQNRSSYTTAEKY
jgi:hypothetical protein